MRPTRFACGVGLVAVLVLGPMAGTVSAHPLGNFTVNQAAHVVAGTGVVTVEHVVDMAEIPTIQERPRIDSNADEKIGKQETGRWARGSCDDVAEATEMTVAGRRLRLVPDIAEANFMPGEAGLQTLRLECRLGAPMPEDLGDAWDLRYEMGSYGDRLGWREVTAQGDGTTLVESDVASTSPSRALTRYPEGGEASPLDERTARLKIRAGGPAASGGALSAVLPPGTDGAANAVLGFLGGQQLGLAVALAALAVSMGLGATHALAPGHGKTIMAASMLSSTSRFSHALTLGVSVAASHTAAVLILAVILSTTTWLLPENLYPLLAVGSGVLVLSVGAGMASRAWRGRAAPEGTHGHHHHGGGHGHAPPHVHDHHHDDEHEEHGEHGGHGHSHAEPGSAGLGRRSLIALGLAGGLVPAPSAIIVLLGASAFGQAWFGVLLVIAYGIGMAATLFVAAWLVIRVRAVAGRRMSRWENRANRLLPLVTSGVVALAGLALGARGIAGLT